LICAGQILVARSDFGPGGSKIGQRDQNWTEGFVSIGSEFRPPRALPQPRVWAGNPGPTVRGFWGQNRGLWRRSVPPRSRNPKVTPKCVSNPPERCLSPGFGQEIPDCGSGGSGAKPWAEAALGTHRPRNHKMSQMCPQGPECCSSYRFWPGPLGRHFRTIPGTPSAAPVHERAPKVVPKPCGTF